MQVDQICKLCGKTSKLQKSHIYPEFLYKDCYDENHRFIRFNTDKNAKVFLSKGLWEHLLCVKCEQYLSKIENRFKRDWHDSGRLYKEPMSELLHLRELDYTSFKLFHLSILWRCSVSTRREFSGVHLGPHEERIAQLILNGEAGEEQEYMLGGWLLLDDFAKNDGSIMNYGLFPPMHYTIDGNHVYLAGYGGCEWFFVISKHEAFRFKEICFRSDGNLYLVRTPFTESFMFDFITKDLQTQDGRFFLKKVKRLRKKQKS